MRFCRACFAVLKDDESICPSCGTRWPKSRSEKILPELVSRKSSNESKQTTGNTNSGIGGIFEKLKTHDEIGMSYHVLEPLDVIAIAVFLAILAVKIWFSLGTLYQSWDGYVYLLNARAFVEGLGAPNYFEVLRPPLLPFMILEIWQTFGEGIGKAAIISPIFTVAAGTLLYALVKEMFDARAGLIASAGFLLSPTIMTNTDLILVHGISVFFVTLTIFSLWRARREPAYYAIAGASIAFASLTRYPDFLVIIVAAIFLLVDLKEKSRKRRDILKWSLLGAAVFVLLWLPWFWWCQAVYNDPLVSLKLGTVSGYATTTGVWNFYLLGLPTVLTFPGLTLLILGIASRGWLRDRRRIFFGFWFLIFFIFYSSWPNQDLRFMVEWAPPLFALIGIGASPFIESIKTSRSLVGRISSISVSTLVGVWLIVMLLTSTAAGISAFSPTSYGNVLGSVDGFRNSVSWLNQHMNQTEIGVTDIAPYFSYYTQRFFYNWEYVMQVAAQNHIMIKDALIQLHVKYVVFRNYVAKVTGVANFGFLVPLQSYSEYSIFQLIP